eukprot:5555301-Prymnesium_polylepis.1
MAACSTQWPLVGGAGMGAAAFSAMSERKVAVAGLAGIALEEYASCLVAPLSIDTGGWLSVQLVHRSDVSELLQDLADESQPRFGELLGTRATNKAAVGEAASALPAPPAASNALRDVIAPLTDSQRRLHMESTVLQVVQQ